MLLATSLTEALENQRQVHVNGSDYTLSEFVGAMPLRGRYVEGNEKNGNRMPQGFLVHQPPGSVTPPHFHETNQFQVVVSGSGRIGKYEAAAITVQYANGHTPYGPIAAGAEGICYYTLRQCWDPGAKYMPESRPKLRKGNQRTRVVTGISMAEGQRSSGAVGETVIAPEEDGLAAFMHRLAPGEHAEGPTPMDGGGQYCVVASGSLRHDGREFEPLSALFLSPEAEALRIEAGPQGLDLLVMQFPTLAAGRDERIEEQAAR